MYSNITCTKSTQTERETCSRCGGTGQMPFAVYGGVCFKCGGQRFVLTKRGQAAEEYLRALRSMPARDLVVGQLIRVDSLTMSGASFRHFATISDITVVTAENATVFSVQPDGFRLPCGVGHLRITANSSTYGVHVNELAPDQMVRVGQTAEQKAETLAKALAYQDTLTKQGKPRKMA